MRNMLFFLLSFVVTINAFAQDKIINDANAEQRIVGSFHGIRVSDGIRLVIKQGNEDGVVVSASETQYRDRIKTQVVDGILKIYYDMNLWKDMKKGEKQLKAYVSVKTLDKLHVSSGSDVKIDGTLTTTDIDLHFSSGAKVEGRIEATSVKVDQASGASCRLSGKAESLQIDMESGAHFSGYDFVTGKCNASARSGAKLEVTVEKELIAEAHSGADISYKGTVSVLTKSSNAGGKVKKVG
jgi:hypothetical protein